ncbi:MAG TPA: ferritin family protein [Synergistaceae bacterium]|jgi:rubrerythrin|nr:ferritin family protein [Synergistaceae bacterium]
MKNYKEILKMAVGNEVEAYEFYRDAAAKMKDPAMKKTFMELADEESGHKVLLEGYLNNEMKDMKFSDEKDYKVAETVEAPQTLSTDMAFKDAIALAMKKEQEAMEMYQQFADASEGAKQKETFLELAKMEKGHKVRLEGIYTDIAFIEVW